MSLFAPLAVVVEVRVEVREVRGPREASVDGGARVFRLSRGVAESAITLIRPVPFGLNQPVWVTFALPDILTTTPVALRALVTRGDVEGDDDTTGGSALFFTDPPRETREIIFRYIAGRLGLPGAQAGRR